MKKSLFFLSLTLAAVVSGFTPPLSFILKDAFEGRKGGLVEISLRHRVEVRPGEEVEVDERTLSDRGKIFSIWSGSGVGQSIATSFSAGNYVAADKTFPTRSAAFVKSLVSASADEVRELLIAEQFIRRDQFAQYRPNSNFEGDPQTWDMKQNYITHPGIFLFRTASGASVAVVGNEDAQNRRAVYFDKAQKGLSRLEWKDKGQTLLWDFEQFGKSLDGVIPHKAHFDVNGKTLVTTTVSYRRINSEKQANEFRTLWKAVKANPVSPTAESALKVLLSYR